MNDFKKHFILIKEDLALTDGERSLMRSELAQLPAPGSAAVLSPFLFFTGPMRFAGAFAVLVLATVGGGSALAREALPGDTLYSVKIHLNENVERTLARSPIAKATVDIKHAEERLTEVELLAASGNADEALIEAAALTVEAKVAAASRTAEVLAESGDDEAADSIHTRINSTLLAHADILDAQAAGLEEASGQTLRALSVAVTFAVDEASDAYEADATDKEDNDVLTAALAADRESGAKEGIEALTEALAHENVSEETQTLLATELASIEADYGATRELMAAEEYEDAAQEYREIERRAYRAYAALTSARRITETTGKEVIIAVNAEDVRPESAIDISASTEADPMLMKAATTFMVEATTSTSTELQRSKRMERALQFWVHDREERGERN
jgi:hypothetical protein